MGNIKMAITFIQHHLAQYGVFKTSAGYPVIIDRQNSNDNIITGYVLFDDYDMPVQWHPSGKPVKLPTNNGLSLVPLRKTPDTFEVIPKDEQILNSY